MKKISLLLFFILIVMSTVCLADVAGSYSRASIAITIPTPKVGEKPSFDGVLGSSNGIKIDSVKWYDGTDKEMTSDSTFTSGTTYKAKVNVIRTGGDVFRTGNLFSVYVNNSTNNVVIDSNTQTTSFVSFTWSYTTEGRLQSSGRLSNATGGKAQYLETPEPFKTVNFTYEKFAYGNKAPTKENISWDSDKKTAIEIVSVKIKGEQEHKELSSSDTFGEGGYIIYITFKFTYDYTLADDGKINFNGNTAIFNKQTDGSYEAYQRNSVTKPAETSSSTALTPEEIKERIGEATITRPIEKLSGDYLIPSGKTEKSGDEKKEEAKAEETKAQETKKEVAKISWANASKWAIDELNKANDKGIIPLIFEKEDLTKNITRREFAHVAVKLYEIITKKSAEAEKENPFIDTNDEEVLKAYKLGITKGTGEDVFEPDTEITREQMATMMTRALSCAGIDTKVDLDKVKKFVDNNEFGKWYVDSIYFMSENDIIKGIGENKFGSQGKATREASILISVRSAEKFAK